MMKTERTLEARFEELRTAYFEESEHLSEKGGFDSFDRFQCEAIPMLLEFVKYFNQLSYDCLANDDFRTATRCAIMIDIITQKMLYLFEREEE